MAIARLLPLPAPTDDKAFDDDPGVLQSRYRFACRGGPVRALFVAHALGGSRVVTDELGNRHRLVCGRRPVSILAPVEVGISVAVACLRTPVEIARRRRDAVRDRRGTCVVGLAA